MNAFENNKTYQCPRWDVVDTCFTCSELPEDPFGVAFGAIFRGPDGAEMRVPGFYDDDQTFVLRFSPPDAGAWTFETYASVAELAGLRGTVDATPPRPQQHGPVVIDAANPQHFVYADGTPYFLLAFELDWLFALAGDEAQTLLDQIAANGINHVVMNVFAYDVVWPKDASVKPEHDFSAPDVYPFGGSNDDPDFSTLNVAYFQHLDHVIGWLEARGIVAHLMIYVWNKQVTWPDMDSEADNRFFDYVIARYQAFSNIVWDVSKEALTYGRCDMAYVHERIRRARRLDAYERLLTVHDYAYCSQHPHNVDFISIQTWCSELYRQMLAVRGDHAGKPVFNIEHGGYERSPYVIFPGDYDDPDVCLERNYQCVFAGTYSTYYWQATSWNVVIADALGLPEDERPKFAYYRHLADLFAKYNFATLSPVRRSSSGLCLTNGDDLYLILVPKENYAIHVTLPELAGQTVRATWFDPFTGVYLPQDEGPTQHWREFKSPWAGQMAVVILEVGGGD